MTIELAARIVFSVLMLAVIVSDIRALRIPDQLNILIAAAFVPFAALQGLPWDVLLSHIGIAVFIFLLLLGAALVGQMGGGDVKLGGAIGLWIGSSAGVVLWLVATGIIYAALLILVIMLRKFGLRYAFVNATLPQWLHDLLSPEVSLRKSIIPFGVPLAAGAIYWVWM